MQSFCIVDMTEDNHYGKAEIEVLLNKLHLVKNGDILVLF